MNCWATLGFLENESSSKLPTIAGHMKSRRHAIRVTAPQHLVDLRVCLGLGPAQRSGKAALWALLVGAPFGQPPKSLAPTPPTPIISSLTTWLPRSAELPALNHVRVRLRYIALHSYREHTSERTGGSFLTLLPLASFPECPPRGSNRRCPLLPQRPSRRPNRPI